MLLSIFQIIFTGAINGNSTTTYMAIIISRRFTFMTKLNYLIFPGFGHGRLSMPAPPRISSDNNSTAMAAMIRDRETEDSHSRGSLSA